MIGVCNGLVLLVVEAGVSVILGCELEGPIRNGNDNGGPGAAADDDV